MEHFTFTFTFTDPQVRGRLQGLLLAQADAAVNTGHDKSLLKRCSLFGLHGVLWIKPAIGCELVRVVGFQAIWSFSRSLDAGKQASVQGRSRRPDGRTALPGESTCPAFKLWPGLNGAHTGANRS